jgi:predicted naringenin-chalcone synthase
MSFFIEGTGTASPPGVATQEQAAASAEALGPTTDEERRQLKAIYRMARVRTRRSVLIDGVGPDGAPTQSFFPPRKDANDKGPATSVRMGLYEKAAGPLAVEAARAALADAGRRAEEITHLITVSCTGFVAPGFDIQMIRELGLASSTPRAHIGFMGCHGAFHALRAAKAITDATPEALVLVGVVELCSLHFQYGWSPDLVVANALFADGAGAVVASGSGSGANARAASPAAGGGARWELAMSGAALLEHSNDEMTWRIGDHGFQMTLSSRVPGLIQRSLRPWLDAWLGGRGLGVDRIASWAVHPGGPRILESCAEVTGCTRQDFAVSHEVLSEFGNMSSPTILFILDRLRRRSAPRPCLALGFGPGLSVEGALFT